MTRSVARRRVSFDGRKVRLSVLFEKTTGRIRIEDGRGCKYKRKKRRYRRRRNKGEAKRNRQSRHSSSQLSGSTFFHKLVKFPSRQGAVQFGISIGCGVLVCVSFRYSNWKRTKEKKWG